MRIGWVEVSLLPKGKLQHTSLPTLAQVKELGALFAGSCPMPPAIFDWPPAPVVSRRLGPSWRECFGDGVVAADVWSNESWQLLTSSAALGVQPDSDNPPEGWWQLGPADVACHEGQWGFEAAREALGWFDSYFQLQVGSVAARDFWETNSKKLVKLDQAMSKDQNASGKKFSGMMPEGMQFDTWGGIPNQQK